MKEDRRTHGDPDHTAVPPLTSGDYFSRNFSSASLNSSRVAGVDAVRAVLDDDQLAALDRVVGALA